jgi:hypothetical protein
MTSATKSEGEGVTEIQSLTARAEQLSQDVDWWNTAMIWALVFAAIAAVAVVVTTRIALVRAKQLSDAQDRLIQAKDSQLALDLRGKDEKIAGLEKEAADAKTAQQKVEIDLSKQRERTANAEIELEKVRQRQAPRGIPPNAESAMLSILKGAPPGKAAIVYQQGSPETFGFATTLWSFFIFHTGWQVSKPQPASSIVSGKGFAFNTDVILMMHDLDKPSASQIALSQALAAAGFRIGSVRDDSLPIDLVVLLVSPKF